MDNEVTVLQTCRHKPTAGFKGALLGQCHEETVVIEMYNPRPAFRFTGFNQRTKILTKRHKE